ncbi:hypothetical protein AAFF_G00184160 [Aldrovandia affinis]|uniref:Uncharacterized protein n=1 Tax=Aldrovandia affinis TaxID=143900 RepID=A0AAD7W7F1_9TELE|nr:hypothetical protein AAFF_G00184160 [Aldrovandia affinis]
MCFSGDVRPERAQPLSRQRRRYRRRVASRELETDERFAHICRVLLAWYLNIVSPKTLVSPQDRVEILSVRRCLRESGPQPAAIAISLDTFCVYPPAGSRTQLGVALCQRRSPFQSDVFKLRAALKSLPTTLGERKYSM